MKERLISKITVDVSGLWEVALFLFIIFLIMKLTKAVTWAWVWVFSPLWIFCGLALVILLVAMVVLLLKR